MTDMGNQLIYQSDGTLIKPQDHQKRLKALADNQTEILYNFKGFFPFDFFPNVVTIYRNKVSVVDNGFFNLMSHTTNIPIENINYVTVHKAFPFVTLEISDRYFSEQPVLVKYLLPSQAQKALKIIDGLRTAIQQKIDVARIPKDELIRETQRIGVTSPSH